MQLVVLRHTEMVGELATRRAVMSSTMESALGHSPDVTFYVEVVGELVAEFQRMQE
jgi:hypothetical protein